MRSEQRLAIKDHERDMIELVGGLEILIEVRSGEADVGLES